MALVQYNQSYEESPISPPGHIPWVAVPALWSVAEALRETPAHRRAEGLLVGALSLGRYVVSGARDRETALVWLRLQATTVGLAPGIATDVITRGFAIAQLLDGLKSTDEGELSWR